MTIELCEGRRVRDPKTNWVLEVGKPYKVEKNQFWFRRIDAGDVKLFEKKKVASKPVPKPVEKSDEFLEKKASAEKPAEKPKAKRGKKKKSGVE